MTDLYNGELLDMLCGTEFHDDVQIQCISYALKSGIQMVIDTVETTLTQAALEKVPERILDVMAVELRAPYYRDSLDIDMKRGLIGQALKWNFKAGTTSAVLELVNTVFGEGYVTEWFDFTEPPFTPGTFDIVSSAQITPENVSQYLTIIGRVKNVRSHIRNVETMQKITGTEYAAAAVDNAFHSIVVNSGDAKSGITGKAYAAAGMSIIQRTIIGG